MKHQDDGSTMGAANQGMDELARAVSPSSVSPSDAGAATFLTRPETFQALRQQTHILQSILNSMSDGVVVADEQGKILLFNPAAVRMVGLSFIDSALSERPEHYRAYLPDGLTPFPVQDLPLVRAIRGEAVDECEIIIRHADKPEYTWLSVNARPLVNEHGVLSGGVAVYRDITVHQRIERRRSAQHAVTRVLAECATLREAAPQILRAICANSLGWVVGSLWRVDRQAQQLRWEATWHSPTVSLSRFEMMCRTLPFPPGVGLPGRVWASKQPIWIPDVAQEPNTPRAAIAVQEGLHSAIGFPLVLGSEILGVMDFFSCDIQQPDDDLCHMLASIGSQIGQFVERKETEEALRQEKAFAESLIETAQAIVLVLDRQGQIVSFNPYTEELTGYPLREVQGKDWFTFFLPDREQLLSREVFDQTITNQLTSRAATALRTCAGKEREIKWSNKALRDAGGAIVGMLAIGHDITDLKNAQQQLLQAERLAAIGQMIAGLAHESRNALQRTQACLEMLVPLVKDRSRALTYTAFIQEAQDDLQHLFDEVRGFAAPIVLQQQECHLGEILQQTWTNLSVRRNGRSVRLREKANTQDLCVEGDPFQLERVFRNILENSFDAGPDRLRIVVSWSQASVEGRSALQVVLRDNGQGLSPEQQERIFEPFYTTKTHGTGLGMAIVKRIVEAHGGRIWVSCGRHGGARVQLLFPRRKP